VNLTAALAVPYCLIDYLITQLLWSKLGFTKKHVQNLSSRKCFCMSIGQ